MNDLKIVKRLAQEEYTRQIKLRNGGKIPDNYEVVIKSMMIQLPIREDGSIGLTLMWHMEKVVEVYHKGPVSIIVGFSPKLKGE